MTQAPATAGSHTTGHHGDPRSHRLVLGLSCLAVAAAFLLQVLPDGRVAPRGFPRCAFPPVCPSRVWLGVNCPTCGLTRALVHLAHADGPASFRAHRLGWLVAAAILLQVPYRVWALRRPGPPGVGGRTALVLGGLLIALLLGNWIHDLLVR